MTAPCLVGLFVGGKARRMGGVAKGLLPAPDTGEPLVQRLSRLFRAAPTGPELVLVGDASAYGALGLPSLADRPGGVGPLGGLIALLTEAGRSGAQAVAVAGDLPHVTPELVARLVQHAGRAHAVAPRPSGIWQPLFARYDPAFALRPAERLLADGRLALHGVLDALGEGAVELPLSEAESFALTDWDTPEDAAFEPRRRG